jgi:hypothetical protein
VLFSAQASISGKSHGVVAVYGQLLSECPISLEKSTCSCLFLLPDQPDIPCVTPDNLLIVNMQLHILVSGGNFG